MAFVIDGAQKANLEVFFVTTKSNHFENDAKPYNKRINVFLRQSDFTFVYVM